MFRPLKVIKIFPYIFLLIHIEKNKTKSLKKKDSFYVLYN